jgi:hypothetical protein
VDEVEIDLVEAEPLEAPFERGDRVIRVRIELGRDEDLVARQTAGAERAAHGLFVAVALRGVDVAVSGLQRPADGALGVAATRDPPDAESEPRYLGPVSERPRGSGPGHA